MRPNPLAPPPPFGHLPQQSWWEGIDGGVAEITLRRPPSKTTPPSMPSLSFAGGGAQRAEGVQGDYPQTPLQTLKPSSAPALD